MDTSLSLVEAAILGFVQGLTEFLPISSSGHLALFQQWFNVQASELVFFDVLLHIGTLASVIVFYRCEVVRLVVGFPRFLIEGMGLIRGDKHISSVSYAWGMIAIATFVTGCFGILLEKPLKALFDRPSGIGFFLMVTGLLLLLTRGRGNDRTTTEKANPDPNLLPGVTILRAGLLGLAQGMAIAPGLSRSGTTIAVALYLGLSREMAVRFSFLMSIPAILGACVLEAKDGIETLPVMPAVIGTLVSFVSGLLFLWTLVWIVRAGRIHYFAFYTIPLGVIVLIYSYVAG